MFYHVKELQFNARVIALDRLADGVRAVVRGSLSRPVGEVGDGERTASWVVGLDLDLQRDDRQNYTNEAGERGALVLDQDERVTSGGAFAQALVPVVRAVSVSAGLRCDRVRFAVADRFVDGDPDDSGGRTKGAWSPSLGVLWQPVSALDLYANATTSFETPATTELVNRPSGASGLNPNLDPQRAVSVEAGARGGLGTASVAVYSARVTGALVPFEVSDAPARIFYRNAGSARHRGVEAALALRPFRSLGLSAAVATTDARFLDYVVDGVAFDGNRVPGVTPLLAWVEASVAAPGGGYAAATVRTASRTAVDDANGASSPAYALLDLRAGWPGVALGGLTVKLFGGVTNVLDARYNASVTVNAFGGRYYEPGPGRTVYLGVALDHRATPSN